MKMPHHTIRGKRGEASGLVQRALSQFPALRFEEEEGGMFEGLKHDHTLAAIKRNHLATLLPETGIFFTRAHQFEDFLI